MCGWHEIKIHSEVIDIKVGIVMKLQFCQNILLYGLGTLTSIDEKASRWEDKERAFPDRKASE